MVLRGVVFSIAGSLLGRMCACLSLCVSVADVNRKILHEQSVEKTFIQLLTHSVSCVSCVRV